jgi:hypothetical protein
MERASHACAITRRYLEGGKAASGFGDPGPAGNPWDEWDRLTRFLESARIAFARERDYWASTRNERAAHGRISSPEGHYTVTARRHIDAIDDAETLHGSVLVHSYALAESAAAEKLEDHRSFGGIEDWGADSWTRPGETGTT